MYFPSASKAKKNKDWKRGGPEDMWRNDCGNTLFGFEMWVFGRGEQGRGMLASAPAPENGGRTRTEEHVMLQLLQM